MPEPLVGVIMGSDSDYETMQHAAATLRSFDVPFEVGVYSAHRTPKETAAYALEAAGRGLQAIIAAAGGAAHLAGVVAALTPLPILGVPIQSKALSGVDSLLSIVQMPAGVPAATFSIGRPGAINAALFTIRMLALGNPDLARRLADFHQRQARKVRDADKRVKAIEAGR